MTDSRSYYLKKLKYQYLLKRSLEVTLWALAFTAIIFGISYVLGASISGIYGGIVFLTSSSILFFSFKLNKISEKELLSYVNWKYPELQESADLLIKDPATFTTLETIQLGKTIECFQSVSSKLEMPHHIGKAALSLGASLIIVLLLTLNFQSRSEQNPKGEPISEKEQKSTASVPSSIADFKITVTPPSYTQQPKYEAKTFTLRIPEGSVVQWDLKFNQTILNATVSFSTKDSLVLNLKKDRLIGSRKFLTSAIYQISWQDTLKRKQSSDYYKIEVVEDKTPEISFSDLRQSIELTIKDKPTIELSAKISDDYAVSNAYIIATVAKGSGESVKFREEKLQFTKPQKISGTNITAQRTIDIKKLGLEPGDELYFYAEAFDNQQPTPNRARTETYFITLMDTASQEMTVDAGLGVDLMPEYFRSQRQIIMDTEKLLRNKKTISKKEFNFLSNELGYDQKVLRLKYGEFLGEEFESELAATDEVAEQAVETVIQEAQGKDENMAEKFGHAHDQENEHNLVEEKKPGHSHDEAKDPEAKENPFEAFVHAHDDAEEATYFLQSVRTKLKAALTEMWDAELYLRLYQPEKSLPYQYKALKLLKEVSNDSRIYVHKTGFDPPPIKEEKRLTGDLAEIENSKRDADLSEEQTFPETRLAIAVLDKTLNTEKFNLSPEEKNTIGKAGQELTSLALEKPAQFLPALSLIKNLQSNEIKPGDMRSSLIRLQRILYSALPLQRVNVSASKKSSTQLNQSFIKNLHKLKND